MKKRLSKLFFFKTKVARKVFFVWGNLKVTQNVQQRSQKYWNSGKHACFSEEIQIGLKLVDMNPNVARPTKGWI